MTIDWIGAAKALYDHRFAIGAGAAAIISAGVKTMPAPGNPFSAYVWFYDWSHQFLNITNTRLTAQPIITPPSNSGAISANPIKP